MEEALHIMESTEKTAVGETRRQTEDRPPKFLGWISTDEEEIRRREWRGRTEIEEVAAVDPDYRPFGDYEVSSASGRTYTVEMRSLRERINTCECQDFCTNQLGTCKHIEGVKRHRNGARGRGRKSSGRIEVFLDECGSPSARIAVPKEVATSYPALAREAERHFEDLRLGSPGALKALREMELGHPELLRVSRRLKMWIDAQNASDTRRRERAEFEAELESGRRSLDFLKLPLLPYQVEGVLHLAFGERVLLADDMGLGKTVQAVAACALLRELRGIERVLVVSPASLKAEWEEQIQKFSEIGSTIVFGDLTARRKAYACRDFFTLCNYEQILADCEDLLERLQPDVVILDEAQRIKNWQTKTANAVKRLRSRYAFVLTGTPLENRIDEIYSIVQFLEPGLLGPLFRFNRRFYRLDEKGRPEGLQNLEELADRVSSIMLRRRKEEVESELPGRTTKTFFVHMTDDQLSLYGDHEYRARRLAAIAEKRPLTADEFKMLQLHLACMRMVCDTPYILDSESHDCPKMDEIERLLPDLLEDPGRKIIIFSEWVRMLELVRNYAEESGIEFAWHTGSVPQPRRRAEIRRFREDPQCRLFLSSESGGVGLNLQVADTVINIDQPWNPAKLEQRISRAWRKHQTRPVNVVNLVSEHTIEHRMLGLLDAKRKLAEGVLDRRGDLSEIRLPTSRVAFMERLQAVLDSGKREEEPARDAPTPPSPLDRLCDDLIAVHGAALQSILASEAGGPVLAVLSIPPDRAAEEEERLAKSTGLSVKVIDPAALETMRRLAEAGVISMPMGDLRTVYPSAESADAEALGRSRRAKELANRAERKLKAAALLEGGGFEEEARPPAMEAALLATASLAASAGEPEPEDAESAAAFLLLQEVGEDGLPLDGIRVLTGEDTEVGLVAPVRQLFESISLRTSNAEPVSREVPLKRVAAGDLFL